MEPHNEIDRILSEEGIVRPSSDFAARVMRQVRSEAASPEPIEFPWRRFLPGMLTSLSLVIGTFMVMGWLNAGAGGDGTDPAPASGMAGRQLISAARAILASDTGAGLLWAGGALVLSAALAWWAARGMRPVGRGL